MLDGTPVLDIKPYIPQYDNPVFLSNQWYSDMQRSNALCGSSDELLDHSRIPREAPDGEEGCSADNVQSPAASVQCNEQVTFPVFPHQICVI